MKKIIFKFSITILLIISLCIVYTSTVGIKTTRLNNQIGILIQNLNKDLKIDLKHVKLILDPFKFEIKAKTVGPKLKIRDKTIDLESIKTKISINAFFTNNFSLKNLYISTRSLEIKNLISFARNFKNSPELYLLEKVLKKGFLISDIDLEFSDDGKIKNNFNIKGFIKDSQISLFKKYYFNNINLIFNFNHNVFQFKDIGLSFNNTPISSDEVTVKSIDDNFFIEGTIDSRETSSENQLVSNLIKSYFSKLNLININFDSKNQFSFESNKKFKINNFYLLSEIKLNNLKLNNNLNLSGFFPNVKEVVDLNDHLIKVNYKKEKLEIKGSGNILFQNKDDLITYNIKKQNKSLNFETDLMINENKLLIDALNYKKKPNFKANINLKGSHFFNEKTIIESFSLNENKNRFSISKLIFDKNFNIKQLKKLNLNYFDEDLRQNEITIINKNNIYSLFGPKFNANSFIENLINDDSTNSFKVLNQNVELDIKIDQVYLDKEYVVNNLNGKLSLKKNEIFNADLNAFFSKDKKFKFTVRTIQKEKVTTLFLDHAEPIIKRYKFIKGYKDGSLDFYSSKKGNKSISNLKIYNFRLKELPILTKILTLASLQGIEDVLSGDGISFDEFEMNFNNQNNLMTIEEMYAIGPSISILMDGYIEKDKLVSLRGSLVPATTINKVIGNLPVVGKILVGSKTGEGVFGVSFKIKGSPKNLETTVNPIKTLTPRFITRTLEKIKKN